MRCSPPHLQAPLATATERLFASLSATRGRRIFHPQGLAFRAHVQVGEGVAGVPVLAPGAEHEGIVRLSRALGTPRGRPDFLGVALQIGDEQDVLLASSSRAPLARFAPLPARSFFGTTFSSLLPFHAGTRVALAGARIAGAAGGGDDQLHELEGAAARSPIRITLALGGAARHWQPVASVALGSRLPATEAERLYFDPWRCAGGLVPWGTINALRAPAYRGSRRGRSHRSSA